MAIILDSSTLTRLNAGTIADRGMILFEFGTVASPNYYGFWTGSGPLVYGGITYIGAGSLIDLSALPQVTDGSSVAVTATLTSIPNSDLTPDVLATIEQEIYHQKPVTVMTAYFDIDTRTLLSVVVEYRGRVDKITHRTSAGGQSVLEANFESRARDFLRKGYRMRNDADQKAFAPDDGSLRHVAKASTAKIYFGRATPATPSAGGAGGNAVGGNDSSSPGWDSGHDHG